MLSLCEVGILPPYLTGNGFQRGEVACLGDREALSSRASLPEWMQVGEAGGGGFHAPSSLQLWELPLVWAGVGFLLKVWGIFILGGGNCCWLWLCWPALRSWPPHPALRGVFPLLHEGPCPLVGRESGAAHPSVPGCGPHLWPTPPRSPKPRPPHPLQPGVLLPRWSARARRGDA